MGAGNGKTDQAESNNNPQLQPVFEEAPRQPTSEEYSSFKVNEPNIPAEIPATKEKPPISCKTEESEKAKSVLSDTRNQVLTDTNPENRLADVTVRKEHVQPLVLNTEPKGFAKVSNAEVLLVEQTAEVREVAEVAEVAEVQEVPILDKKRIPEKQKVPEVHKAPGAEELLEAQGVPEVLEVPVTNSIEVSTEPQSKGATQQVGTQKLDPGYECDVGEYLNPFRGTEWGEGSRKNLKVSKDNVKSARKRSKSSNLGDQLLPDPGPPSSPDRWGVCSHRPTELVPHFEKGSDSEATFSGKQRRAHIRQKRASVLRRESISVNGYVSRVTDLVLEQYKLQSYGSVLKVPAKDRFRRDTSFHTALSQARKHRKVKYPWSLQVFQDENSVKLEAHEVLVEGSAPPGIQDIPNNSRSEVTSPACAGSLFDLDYRGTSSSCSEANLSLPDFTSGARSIQKITCNCSKTRKKLRPQSKRTLTDSDFFVVDRTPQQIQEPLPELFPSKKDQENKKEKESEDKKPQRSKFLSGGPVPSLGGLYARTNSYSRKETQSNQRANRAGQHDLFEALANALVTDSSYLGDKPPPEIAATQAKIISSQPQVSSSSSEEADQITLYTKKLTATGREFYSVRERKRGRDEMEKAKDKSQSNSPVKKKKKVGIPEESKKGFGWKMLEKMGFRGQLGANEDGITEPLTAVDRGSRSGLGMPTSHELGPHRRSSGMLENTPALPASFSGKSLSRDAGSASSVAKRKSGNSRGTGDIFGQRRQSKVVVRSRRITSPAAKIPIVNLEESDDMETDQELSDFDNMRRAILLDFDVLIVGSHSRRVRAFEEFLSNSPELPETLNIENVLSASRGDQCDESCVRQLIESNGLQASDTRLDEYLDRLDKAFEAGPPPRPNERLLTKLKDVSQTLHLGVLHYGTRRRMNRELDQLGLTHSFLNNARMVVQEKEESPYSHSWRELLFRIGVSPAQALFILSDRGRSRINCGVLSARILGARSVVAVDTADSEGPYNGLCLGLEGKNQFGASLACLDKILTGGMNFSQFMAQRKAPPKCRRVLAVFKEDNLWYAGRVAFYPDQNEDEIPKLNLICVQFYKYGNVEWVLPKDSAPLKRREYQNMRIADFPGLLETSGVSYL